MKKPLIAGLALILLLALLMVVFASCETAGPASASKSITVEITLDDLAAKKSMTKFVEMVNGGTLTVMLGANPTTGYSWTDAGITGGTGVVKQMSRNYEKPADTSMAGAGGTEVWVFKATDTGLAQIKMSYSQPGVSGGDIYDVTVNVNIRDSGPTQVLN